MAALALCAGEGYTATRTHVGLGGAAPRGPLSSEPGSVGPTLAVAPEVIFVVVGDVSSGDSTGVTPTFTIPMGGTGSQVSWTNQSISYPSGHVTSSGSASSGSLQAHFTGQLDFSPTRGTDFYNAHVTVNAYVRGAEQCFKTQCSSSGTISVAHAQGCDPAAGPFVAATWNTQTIGSLNSCTADATAPITSEACADSGTSCCATVQFPEAPGVDYSLAVSKTYDGRVSQATVGQLAGGVPIVASFDVQVSVSAALGCAPPGGRVVISHDVNTFGTDVAGPQEAAFAVNVARYLTCDRATRNLLLFDSNPGDGSRDFSPVVLKALSGAGFSVTVTSDYTTSFSSFDAIFVAENFPDIGFLDNNALIDYVSSGGGVYLAGGVGTSPSVEADGWRTFLSRYGLAFDSSGYNGINSVTIHSTHPIFTGISTLGSGNGQSIIDLGTNSSAEIIESVGGQGVYAVGGVTRPCGPACAASPGPGVISDNFDDNSIDPSLWRVRREGVGPTEAERNGRLELDVPPTSSGSLFLAGYVTQCAFIGDFDAQVDYHLLDWPGSNGVRLGLGLGDTTSRLQPVAIERVSQGGEQYLTDLPPGTITSVPTTDTAGTLRITRVGNLVAGYYRIGCDWQLVSQFVLNTEPVVLSILGWSHDGVFVHQHVLAAFDNFVVTHGTPVACAPTATCGRIFLANDEWTLSDNANASPAADGMVFARNLASWLTKGKVAARFLAYSDNFGLIGTTLANTMRAAGYVWRVSTAVPFTLDSLQQYDGVFLGGYAVNDSVLAKYVNAGGAVYLCGGTGTTGHLSDAAHEAAQWNPFLSTYGLAFASTYNGVSGVVPISSPHPVFAGVHGLFEDIGQSIQYATVGAARNGEILVFSGADGLYAIADTACNQVATRAADLTVASVESSTLDVDCQTLRANGAVSATVENVGGVPAGAFAVQFFEDRNSNGVFDAGVDGALGLATVPSLGAGEQTVVQATADGHVRFPGSPVYAFADVGNLVLETDETNNVGHSEGACRLPAAQAAAGGDKEMRIGTAGRRLFDSVRLAKGARNSLPTPALDAADLTASSVRFEFHGCPDSFAIAARVGNGGSSGTAAPVSVAFYDGDPTLAGRLLGVASTKFPLAPGAFEDVVGRFPSPPPGDHVFWVRVNCDSAGHGLIAECNETNNTCSVAGTVPSKPSCTLSAPDLLPECGSSGNRLCVTNVIGSVSSYQWKVISGGSGWGVEDGQGTTCLTYHAGSPGDTVTVRVILATSAGCMDSCETRFTCRSPAGGFVTLTQGGWGNSNGSLNGERRSQTLARIVTPSRPLVLGVPKSGTPASFGSITFTDNNENCILQLMPGGGTPRPFVSNLKDVSPTTGNHCSVSPQTIKSSKFDNVLIGQALALSLNARLDEGLPAIALKETLWTAASAPGSDGKIGTPDDVCTTSSRRMILLRHAVLDALDVLGLPKSVAGLMQLANRALSGLVIAPATAVDVSDACAAINEGFDGGRCLVGPAGPAPAASSLAREEPLPTAFALLQNVPNPFGRGTTLRFALPERSRVELTVYNLLGEEVARPVSGDQPAGMRAVDWQANGRGGRLLPSGVYFMRMRAVGLGTGKSFTATKRMVLFR